MTLSKKQKEQLKKIMSVKDEMIRLLPLCEYSSNMMHPFVRQLPGIIRGLKIKKDDKVIDAPCGQGGTAVHIAKRHGAKIFGYDIMKEFIKKARSYASKNKVAKLCKFYTKDITKVTKKGSNADYFFWFAAPHVWKDANETIKALRNCVKNSGIIVIGDAYTYTKSKEFPEYEKMNELNKAFTHYGDEIIRIYDYKGTLWTQDYKRERKSLLNAIKKVKNIRDKQILKKNLSIRDKEEKLAKKELGLAIWIIKVNK